MSLKNFKRFHKTQLLSLGFLITISVILFFVAVLLNKNKALDTAPEISGGKNGQEIYINNLEDLQSWAKKRKNAQEPVLVSVSGKFISSSTIIINLENTANISIIGEKNNADLKNIGINIINSDNIIIKNLSIHEVLFPGDAININNSQNILITHCELYSKVGEEINNDTYDGLIDINNGSRYIIISWSFLHNHMKVSLIGDDNNPLSKSNDENMSVTFHHNWFKNTTSRNPSIRYGSVHLYNNYFEDIPGYALATRLGAHALLENNYFKNVKIPMTTDAFQNSEGGFGKICEKNSIFDSKKHKEIISESDCDFWSKNIFSAQYVLDNTEDVPLIVKSFAGLEK